MKKLTLAVLATVTMLTYAAPAYAMTYYLTRQWIQGGNNFCQYSNGTVLNMGYRTCPMSIQG